MGKASTARKQRVCRCNVLPLFYCAHVPQVSSGVSVLAV